MNRVMGGSLRRTAGVRTRLFLALLLSFPGLQCADLSRTRSLEEEALASLSQIEGEIELPALKEPVEIMRDQWGVPHIYAQNREDLFFAQGFVAAQDRLWQMELWRRTFEGRLSEIVGPEAFEHDRLARLVHYRGPWEEAEWTSYHPEGKAIMTSFVEGINAFIAHRDGNHPVEFKLTGVRPQPWTPETPLLRSPRRVLGFARSELSLARKVAELGLEEANRQAKPDPWNELKVPPGLDVSIIPEEAVKALEVFVSDWPRPELLPGYRETPAAAHSLNRGAVESSPGSNNWVISGSRTAGGSPLLANDPHRQVTNPALRYIVHLNAPGWNVIGAGEPGFPGVAIGHNERIAWGLTIVGTDQADIFVEEVNPNNPNQVRWNGEWVPLEIVMETIPIKGEAPRQVELKFSRHGPIFYEDRKNHRAYALRSILQEPGTAEYVASLRVNQADSCREFLRELAFYKAPSENMICADVEGNIAWMPAALTPKRQDGWYGRLPVPGNGGYEWKGFRNDLPSEYNPDRGWIATANHNIHPPGYDPPLFFKSGPPYRRFERIAEVLSRNTSVTVEDSKRLHHDAYNSAAAENQPFFQGWQGSTEQMERARRMIVEWDAMMDRNSAAAALYMAWVDKVDLQTVTSSSPPTRVSQIEKALLEAIQELNQSQGQDWSQWRWGRIHRSEFPHPLVQAYDLPAVERSGGAGTVAATGATYREIFDLSNWDHALATMTPGQSGQPGSPFYGDLLAGWAEGEYFALLFSRQAVESKTRYRLVLKPTGESE